DMQRPSRKKAQLVLHTNGRRRRNPSTRNVRQSRGHGRGILCLHAYCYSSGTGECADWRHHHAWNAKPQKPGAGVGGITGIVLGREELGTLIWALIGAVVVSGVVYFHRSLRR